MWIFILYSFALAHGALAEFDCSKAVYENCEPPAIYTFVPTDVSEFNRLCPLLLDDLRCIKGFQEQCEPESLRFFENDGEYEEIYSLFRDVCQEGTFLNRVATENLRCFNETFRTTSCPEKVKAFTGPYRSPIEGTEDEDDYDLPIAIMCLQDILESNCIAADIGKNCGQDALEATLELLRRISYTEDVCGKRNAEELLKNLDKYKLDQEQKVIVIAALEKVIIFAKE